MTLKTPRPVAPRRWRDLALAGAAATLAGPVMAQTVTAPMQPGAATGVWTVQAEGGEGGEAGAVAEASPDVAYQSRLAIVEGHMVAAVELYRKGMVDDAVGLSGHPEAEMMDEVRADLHKHGAADFSPQMEALGQTLSEGAAQVDVEAALLNLQASIKAAMQHGDMDDKVMFESLVRLTRAAGVEYAGSIEDGKVTDPITFHEAIGFVSVGRGIAATLAASSNPVAAKAGAKAAGALDEAASVIANETAPDATILPAAAAKIELAAFPVK